MHFFFFKKIYRKFLKLFNFFKIKEEDYETVIECLSAHIPKIYDESQEPEIVFTKQNGKAHYNIKKVHKTNRRLVRKQSVSDGNSH